MKTEIRGIQQSAGFANVIAKNFMQKCLFAQTLLLLSIIGVAQKTSAVESVSFPIYGQINISGNETTVGLDCRGGIADGTIIIPFTYTFAFNGSVINTNLTGCCGLVTDNYTSWVGSQFSGAGSYGASVQLGVPGEICGAGLYLSGVPSCFNVIQKSTPVWAFFDPRPAAVDWNIELIRNTNSYPVATWTIKDASGNSQGSQSENGHYQLTADGMSQAIAAPVNTVETPIFVFADTNEALRLGCTLTTNGVLTAGTNYGTVQVIAQVTNTDVCLQRDFWFDFSACAACQLQCKKTDSQNKSVDVRWNLGPSSVNAGPAFLQLKSIVPDPAVGTPQLLRCDFIRPDLEPITNSLGWLRQVRALDRIVDILTNSTSSYSLLFYSPTNLLQRTNGLYQFKNSPYQTVTVQLVGGDTNQVRITDSLDAGPADYVWGGTGWTLTTGNGLRNETKTLTQAGSVRTEVRTIKNALNIVESYSYEKWQSFSFGDRLIEEVSGSIPNAITNSYSYATNGLRSQVTNSDGSWEIFQYDTMGRQTARFFPFTNNAPTTNAALCRVISNTYSNSVVSGSGDDARIEAYTPRQVTDSIMGVEVSRRYTVLQLGMRIDIQCANPGAAWNNSSNLFTTNYLRTDAVYLGKPWKIVNPDGTMQLFAYSDAPLSSKSTWTGAPDATYSSVVDGTQEDVRLDEFGHITNSITKDIASSIPISSNAYFYDDQGHLTNTTYLDGTHEVQAYDCCNLISSIERDGTTSSYTYDDLKRLVTTTRAGITTSNVYDSVGNVLRSVRYGTDGTTITTSQTAYNDGGQQISSTDRLNNVTSYTNYLDTTGQVVRTTTYPDLTTRVETSARDGSLIKVSGTAVHAVRYEYGVVSDGGFQRRYTREIKLDASGNDTSEWTKTYTDGAGRAYKVVYADATGTPSSQSFYNIKGQLSKQVDPDGVTTLYQYTAKGELEYSALDINTNGVIDFSGTDRITRSIADVTTDNAANVRRTLTYVWSTTNSTASNLVSIAEASVDGLHSWQTVYRDASTSVTSRTDTVYSGNGVRYVTNTAPDKSYTVSQYQYGRLLSSTSLDGLNSQIAKATYTYDAHGRQFQMTDARNGTATYGYNNADMVTTVTTPPPGNGQSPQTTATYYNNRLQVTNVVAADGVSKFFEYLPTGELKKSWSGRDYPVAYSYDYAGRAKTMTNWTTFSTGAGARVTTWNYDLYRGWLTNKVYDGGISGPNYTYTTGGRLQTRKWARIGTSSQRIQTTYTYGFNGPTANNAHGDLVSVTYTNDPQSTPAITNSYDRLGRTASLLRNGITNFFAYNLANQTLFETNRGGMLHGWGITNAYDLLLRRATFQVTTGTVVKAGFSYGYDNASRLQTVSNVTYNAAYTYLANAPLVGQITLKSNATTRLTMTKAYDNLNRLQSIQSSFGSTPVASFNYLQNDANQRVRTTLPDGSFWIYEYDSLGQVRSGKRYWSDNTPVAGQQFEYDQDDIGNRKSTKAGGDENGANLRSASYLVNGLNQYTNRTVPGAVDIIGVANALATVTINTQAVYRKVEYYRKELAISNTTTLVWQSVTNKAVQSTTTNTVIGNVFLPKTPELFSYDGDGNLLTDGRWTNSWDAENRLVNLTSLSNAPMGSKFKLDLTYDYLGRRLQKTVSTNNGTAYVGQSTNRFLYDGWKVAAVLNHTNGLLYSFQWGTDLSGTMQGAGGVGGLLSMTVHLGTNAGTYFYCYDGNGNVTALVNATNGALAAQYEYGPFGEVIRATGPMAKTNPFRFSTKYQDDETDLLYYGYRYYNPSTGRWLSRDPIEEKGGNNLYSFINNAPIYKLDALGLVTFQEGSVANGKISYSCNCGWIDWDHLNESGSRYVNQINAAISSYEQSGKSRFGIQQDGTASLYGAMAVYEFTYRTQLDIRARVLLNLDIAMHFGSLYETAQLNWIPGISILGGFSVEDLPSNYMGALIRLNELLPGSTGITRDVLRKKCNVLNTEDSLRMYKFGTGPFENKSYIPNLWNWRGTAAEISPGGGFHVAKSKCDPCEKAEKKLPNFFSDFAVGQASSLYKVRFENAWGGWK